MAFAGTAFLIIVGSYLAILTAYLVVITLAACFPGKDTAVPREGLRFAVVIPAFNEEGQIERAIASVLACPVPDGRLTVFAIADNCTDRTAEVARNAGAQVAVRSQPDCPGKGQALDWFLREHREVLEDSDAIVVIDADSVVDPRFFAEIAVSLADPTVQVVQGYHGVANPTVQWRTALTFAGFAGVNHVRPKGRCRLGGTAGLAGNGMVFRTGLLLGYGWPAGSIAEDIEFGLWLLLDGVPVSYNGRAIVVSDMPATSRGARPQRRRWEGGRFQLLKGWGLKLAKAFLKRPRWRTLDALLELSVPPLALVAAMQFVYLVAAVLSRQTPWLVLALACMAATALYVVVGLVQRRAPARVWVALSLAPVYVLWKIPVYAGLLLRGDKGWVRTPREGEQRDDGTP